MTTKSALIAAVALVTFGGSFATAQVASPPAAQPAIAQPPAAQPPAAQPPAAQPAAVVPSQVDDLQTLVDAKKFPEAMKLATKLISLHGPAAGGINRFRVLMLRGDAIAGTKAVSSAINTYKAALKETTDPREMALAKWTIELFTKAKGTTFSPKVAGGGAAVATLNLNDRVERKQAFSDLLSDELAVLAPKIHLATVSMQLGDIVPVLTQVEGLEELDVVANDNNTLTSHVASDLLDHSHNLLSSTLKGMWTRIGDIDTAANTATTSNNPIVINGVLVNQQHSTKPGLTAGNRSELNDMVTTAKKISAVTALFVPLAQSDKDWLQIKNDAERVVGRASDLLANDFSQSNTTVSGTGQDQSGSGVTTVVPNNISGGISYGGSNGVYPGGIAGQTNPTLPTTPATTTPPKTPAAPTAPTTPTQPHHGVLPNH